MVGDYCTSLVARKTVASMYGKKGESMKEETKTEILIFCNGSKGCGLQVNSSFSLIFTGFFSKIYYLCVFFHFILFS